MSVTTLLTEPATQYVAEGINQWVQGKASETTTTIKVLLALGGIIAFVVISAAKKFAVGAIVVGLFVGGVIGASPWLLDSFSAKTKDEVRDSGPASVSAPAFSATEPLDLTQPIRL